MSEHEIKFCFQNDDDQMKKDIEMEFGDKAKYSQEFAAIGIETFTTVVVPIVSLTVQLIDFIISHYETHKKDKRSADEQKKVEQRELEIDGKRLSLKGYSSEEIVTILNAYMKTLGKNE